MEVGGHKALLRVRTGEPGPRSGYLFALVAHPAFLSRHFFGGGRDTTLDFYKHTNKIVGLKIDILFPY